MNIPKGFAQEKQKKEIEDIVRKTVVDKVLVENIAQKLETYLEKRELAKIPKINFKKTFDLLEDKNLNTEIVKKAEDEYGDLYDIKSFPNYIESLANYKKLIKVQNIIQVIKKDLNDLRTQETNQILERLLELEPSIKEEEIIKTYTNSFNIISKDFIYDLILHTYDNRKEVSTGEVFTFGKIFKKTVPVVNVDINPRIEGYVKYAKFDKEHNEKLIRVFKERGYKVDISIG